MAEACIGIALLTFIWMLFSFVCYLSNNQIRTVMAARHAAWMMGHNQQPTAAALADSFGFDNAGLVQLNPPPKSFDLSVANAVSGNIDYGTSDGANSAWLVTVSYGITTNDVKTTSIYPFTLLNTHVPLMPDLMLNYSIVQSQCAWPANTDDQWQDATNAFKEIIQLILNEAGGLIKWIGSLFS
jgi:hypothetical protein